MMTEIAWLFMRSQSCEGRTCVHVLEASFCRSIDGAGSRGICRACLFVNLTVFVSFHRYEDMEVEDTLSVT